MLSQGQTKWIFQKINDLVDYYEKYQPVTDEEWEQLASDVKIIYKKSRKNELCKQILLGVLTYFERGRSE
jgi:hypothetical protein